MHRRTFSNDSTLKYVDHTVMKTVANRKEEVLEQPVLRSRRSMELLRLSPSPFDRNSGTRTSERLNQRKVLRFGNMLMKRPTQFHAVLLTNNEESLKNLWFAIQASVEWTSAFARNIEDVSQALEGASHGVVFADLDSQSVNSELELLYAKLQEREHLRRTPLIGILNDRDFKDIDYQPLLEAGLSRLVPIGEVCTVAKARNLLLEIGHYDLKNLALLRALEGALHALDMVESPICFTDSQQTIQFANQAYGRLANRSQDSLLGRRHSSNFLLEPDTGELPEHDIAALSLGCWTQHSFKHPKESPELQQTIKILTNSQTAVNGRSSPFPLSSMTSFVIPMEEDPVAQAFYHYYVAPLELKQLCESMDDFLEQMEASSEELVASTSRSCQWNNCILSEANNQLVQESLDRITSWQFDLFGLCSILKPRTALKVLAAEVFQRFKISATLRLTNDGILLNWLDLVTSNYQEVPYHNYEHAADVLQCVAYFLDIQQIHGALDNFDRTVCVIAAVIHDIGHMGRNNQFLINMRDPLAIQYNDQSVLENYHASLGISLTLGSKNANIFAHLSSDELVRLRQGLINLVLATDISQHFQALQRFEYVLPKLKEMHNIRKPQSLPYVGNVVPVQELMKAVLKAADISNPCRPWKIAKIWAKRITEEFVAQSAEEELNGIPPFIKGKVQLGNGQVYFGKIFVLDLYDKLRELAPTLESKNGPCENLKTNLVQWVEYDQRKDQQNQEEPAQAAVAEEKKSENKTKPVENNTVVSEQERVVHKF